MKIVSLTMHKNTKRCFSQPLSIGVVWKKKIFLEAFHYKLNHSNEFANTNNGDVGWWCYQCLLLHLGSLVSKRHSWVNPYLYIYGQIMAYDVILAIGEEDLNAASRAYSRKESDTS